MKKKHFLVIAIFFIIISSSVLLLNWNKERQTLSYYDITLGNTPGNIINGGFVAENKGWVYYSNHTEGYYLYKKKKDGSENVKLNSDNTSYINVIGDTIVYCNNSDNEKIYMMKDNGAGNKALSGDRASNIIYNGQWIYYINISADNRIYRISPDGKRKEKISEEAAAEFCIGKGYLFYTIDGNGSGIYRIKDDGKENQILSTDKAVYLNYSNDWLYYKNESDGYSLFKIKMDGTGRKRLLNKVVDNINVQGKWIYYLYDGINKIGINGKGYEKVLQDNAVSINVFGDWIYFKRGEASLFRIGLDGSKWGSYEGVTVVKNYEEVNLARKNGTEFTIKDGQFKEEYDKTSQIIRQIIKPGMSDLEIELAIHDYLVTNTKYDEDDYNAIVNEKGKINVDSHSVYGVLVKGLGVCEGYAEAADILLNLSGIESHIVYGKAIDSEGGVGHAWNLVKIDGEYYQLDVTWDDPVPDQGRRISYEYFNRTDGELSKDHEWTVDNNMPSTSSKYSYFKEIQSGVRVGEWIYYEGTEKENFNLYKIKIDGTGRTRLNSDNSAYVASDGQWIYYSNYSQGGYLYRIRNDGSGRVKLNTEWSKDIQLEGNFILYTDGNDNRQYKIMKDGSKREKVYSDKSH